MLAPAASIAVYCFIAIHSPDGKDVTYVDAAHVFMIRPLAPQHEQHVAKGVRTILYIDGQKVGVSETPQEIQAMLKECEVK